MTPNWESSIVAWQDKHRALAKVAVARKLAIRLYLILREDWTYADCAGRLCKVSPSHSVAGQ